MFSLQLSFRSHLPAILHCRLPYPYSQPASYSCSAGSWSARSWLQTGCTIKPHVWCAVVQYFPAFHLMIDWWFVLCRRGCQTLGQIINKFDHTSQWMTDNERLEFTMESRSAVVYLSHCVEWKNKGVWSPMQSLCLSRIFFSKAI
jgi:hypothetical protein